MDAEHIKTLLSLPENDLLILIGDDLMSSESRFTAPDTTELVNKANIWLKEQYAQFQCTICNNKVVLICHNKDDLAGLVVAISDLIASICIGVSPFTVAALIVKMGVDSLCCDTWKSKI
jgi:hypothetical protein